MSRIGIVTEQSPETRVAATPATVKQLTALGYEVVVEAGAGAASSFPDEAYLAAGAADRDRAPRRSAATSCSRSTRPRTPRSRRSHPARRSSGCWLPRSSPSCCEALADSRRHRARHGRRAAHLARPVDGRAQLDGEHRRVPGGRRGGARVRPLLHRARSPPRARCRPPRCSSPAPASPDSRRSARRRASAPSCVRPTLAPRSPTR